MRNLKYCWFVIALAVLANPAAALAAEEETKWGILELIGRFFNLGVVVIVLYFALRKPLGQYFDERRQNIRKSLEDAQQAYQQAQSKLAEMEKKMTQLDAEMAQIKQNAVRAAEEERRRTLDLTEKEAERIINLAHREAEALVRAARQELRQHAADLAVALAQDKIRQKLNPEDERRLAEQFAGQLGKKR